MNYVKIRIGDLFKLVSEVVKKPRKPGEEETRTVVKQICRKTSHTGYIPLGDDSLLGEVQFTQEIDDKLEYPIKPDAAPEPTPVPEPAKEATVAPVKKAAKNPAAKTASKNGPKSPPKKEAVKSTKKKARQ